ncbi:MAG: YegS/Rv2252/BmrU family lipid kinase [Ruminococcaceae bacterium]|nr:YegS/Rv2252/BmrU family lipid kinase [Oscillospiraceae bacterium]
MPSEDFTVIYHFILNPKSGRPRKQQNLEDIIKSACRKRQLSYHIYYTTCPGDATEYVSSMMRISQERQRFICIGGDGTLSEIVNSAPGNNKAEFGVVPYGSGNDFVRNFTNKELFFNIDAQIDGETVSLDLIKYNDAYSINMINIGFDCAAAKEAAKIKKLKITTPAFSYTLGVLKVFFRRYGTKMRLIFDDGEIWDGIYTLASIGNGKFYGGGYRAAPLAKMDDGLMDICAINKVSHLTLLKLINSYKKGTYLENPKAIGCFNFKKANHIKIEFESPEPICIDGEIKGAKTLDLSIVKNTFNFVIPKGSDFIR